MTDEEKKQNGYRWEVIFLLGTTKWYLVNLNNNMRQTHHAQEPITEQNFAGEFRTVCEAGIRAGFLHENDRVLCTTFPEGTTEIEVGGTA